MSTPDRSELHATCAAGLQHVLRDELVALGIDGVRLRGAGAGIAGGLEAGYTACLHSRVANRILLPLHAGPAPTPEALYALVREVDWSAHLASDGTLAVDFFSAASAITHTQYGAQKVKDAIVDQFRDAIGVRPDVQRVAPDVRVNVYVYRDRARLAIDLAGESLHRRGYRGDGGPAPLKENVAAALLLAAGWPARAAASEPFVDPLCGSGTLVVEAAMIAAHRAPGLGRAHFGFLGWRGHDVALWDRLVAEAEAAVRPVEVPVRGFDREAAAVVAGQASLRAAGLNGDVRIERRDVHANEAEPGDLPAGPGLVLSNPPWGERLAAGDADYQRLGHSLSRRFPGWRCVLFTATRAPLAALALPLQPLLETVNGGIDCRLSAGDVPRVRSCGGGLPDVTPALNRIAKNRRALKGFLRRHEVRAWRVYDADLPDFAIAVDLFDCGERGDERHLVVQEYAPPRTVNAALAADRLEAFVAALPAALDTPAERVHLKTRERQRGRSQYPGGGRDLSTPARLHERGARYALNFDDYLDVGLFLDHRPVRRWIRESMPPDGRFLNLFAYTASATVEAALGGATESVSVDLSNRYVGWARRNLALNALDADAHLIVRSDASAWLASAEEAPFDVILLDPPTHSNSSALARDWDVQADHVATIDACMARLAPGGTLVFSNNFRRFVLDPVLGERYAVQARGERALDPDAGRRGAVHRSWLLRHPD